MKRLLFSLIVLILGCNNILSQNISGIVYDEIGLSMPGVTVAVAGTKTGTVTDFDGVFEIKADKNAKLIFNFLGYKEQTISINGKTNLVVNMDQESMMLEEVVAVGYGSRKKVNLTGAVETVGTEDLASRTLTNASQALQGKVSGVIITQNSGQPGQDGAQIRIRGVSSIENSNDPLVIIDGVEGDLADIHPNDIESMSVLKDASSAAIYGNRAAAGVIIVTTKSGKEGGLKVNARHTISVQQVTRMPEVAKAYDYARLLNEARLNSGYPNVPYEEEKLQEIKDGSNPALQNVDLNDIYFSPAIMNNSYISLSGGEKRYNFAFTAGYLDQNGVMYGTGASQLTYRAKLNGKFWDNKVRVGLSLGGYTKKEEELSSSTVSVMSANASSSPIGFFQATDPETGEPGMYGLKARYYAIQEAGGGTNIKRTNLNYQASLEIEPIKGLKGKVLYSQTHYRYNKDRLLASVYLAGNPNEDVSSTVTDSQFDQIRSGNTSSTFTATISYDNKFNNHHLSALIGYEYLTLDYDSYDYSIKFLSGNQPVFPFGDPSTLTAGSDLSARATMSYFLRVGYDYKGKYMLESNVRRDGSSRFAQKNRWGIFPSFSAGWRISEESFMEDAPVELKLRGSWGVLGNERMSEYYPTYDVLSAGEYYNFGGDVVQGTGTTLLGNDKLVWERSQQTNIGLDAVLFDDFSISANYFMKKTTGILGRVEIPYSMGLGNSALARPYQNIGSMSNSGVETTFGYNKQWNDWRFSGTVNFSYLTNEVLDLGGLDYVSHDPVSGFTPPSDIIRSQVGNPFGSYYGLLSDGIYQVEDFVWQDGSNASIPHREREYKLKDGSVDPSAILTGAQPGDIRYQDITGDGKITEDDITYMGSSQPKFVYSLQLYAEYKSWSLNVLGQGVAGAKSYIMGPLVTPFWGGRGNISQEIVDNHWTFENPSNTHQRVYDDSKRANIVSDYYLQDASYFRVKNIELAYRFDNIKRYVDNIRLSLSVENPFLFTKMDGFDPEKSFDRITPDFHPQVRMYSFGLNIAF